MACLLFFFILISGTQTVVFTHVLRPVALSLTFIAHIRPSCLPVWWFCQRSQLAASDYASSEIWQGRDALPIHKPHQCRKEKERGLVRGRVHTVELPFNQTSVGIFSPNSKYSKMAMTNITHLALSDMLCHAFKMCWHLAVSLVWIIQSRWQVRLKKENTLYNQLHLGNKPLVTRSGPKNSQFVTTVTVWIKQVNHPLDD